MYNLRIYLWKQCAIHVTRWYQFRGNIAESSLSKDIIVLEAVLEAERDGVAAMNEVIFILRLLITELASRIMQATQELEEVRMFHLKTEQVLLFLLSEAQGNPGSSLDTS